VLTFYVDVVFVFHLLHQPGSNGSVLGEAAQSLKATFGMAGNSGLPKRQEISNS